MLKLFASKLTPVDTDSALPGVEFHDRRKFAIQAHGPERQWKVTTRSLKDVTGVCMHQTACVLGERPERWDTVGAHFGVTRSGKVIWMHDFLHRVAAANGWNNGTVSVEFDGLLFGVEGDIATVWDDPSTKKREQGMELTEEQVKAGKQLLRWIKRQVPGLKVIVAHRQSSPTRRNDPGEAVWKRIVIPVSAELGLSDGGVGFKLDNGYPIPEAWDPRCKGIKY